MIDCILQPYGEVRSYKIRIFKFLVFLGIWDPMTIFGHFWTKIEFFRFLGKIKDIWIPGSMLGLHSYGGSHKHMQVFVNRSSPLFTVCQYRSPFLSYISHKLGCFGRDSCIPYNFSFKNHAHNEHKMINYLPIFGNKTRYVFSHVSKWVIP